VAGTTAGVALQLIAATLTTSWLVNLLTEHFDWLKWLGIAYLVYFALRQVPQLRNHGALPQTPTGSFQRGFWVALSNPKTLLFFTAFLPQFTIPETPYAPQITLLSLITLMLTLIRDIVYMLLAHRVSFIIQPDG